MRLTPLHPLPLLLVAHALVALGYLVIVPPWEAPDEPAHLRRIAALACRFGLASRDPDPCRGEAILGDEGTLVLAPRGGCAAMAQPEPHDRSVWTRAHLLSSYEAYLPPLGHLAYVLPFLLTGPRHPVLFPDPAYPATAPGVFLHDLDALTPYAATVAQLRVLRLTGIVFGLLTVAGSWAIAGLLAPGRRDVAIAAAAFTAFLPQFTFAAGTLGTDLPGAAAGAGFLVCILRSLRTNAPASPGGVAVAAALLLAAIGSRPNAMPLVAVGVVAILIAIGRRRGRRAVVSALAIGAGGLALGAGLLRWTLPSWWRTVVGQAAARLSGGTELPFDEAAARLGRSFVGEFGWLDVRLPPAATLGAGLLALALLASLVVFLARASDAKASATRPLILLAAFGVAILATVAVLNATATAQAQGRYLFPLLAAIAALVGLAACAPFPARAGRVIAWGLAALLLGGNVVALLGVVRPAYAGPASGLLTPLATPGGALALLHGATGTSSGFAAGLGEEWLLAAPEGATLDLNPVLQRPLEHDLNAPPDPLPFEACGVPPTGEARLERGRLVGRLAPGGTLTLRWHEPPRAGPPPAAPLLSLGE